MWIFIETGYRNNSIIYPRTHWIHRGADKSLARRDWKNNWKVAIFRLTWRSLLPRRPGWTDNLMICFWVACKSQSLVASACFLPGRAKDLSAPRCCLCKWISLKQKYTLHIIHIKLIDSRRHSSVSIVTSVGGICLCWFRTDSGTYPTYTASAGVLSSGIERPEREADHSPSNRAQIKNRCRNTSISSLRLHGVKRNSTKDWALLFQVEDSPLC